MLRAPLLGLTPKPWAVPLICTSMKPGARMQPPQSRCSSATSLSSKNNLSGSRMRPPRTHKSSLQRGAGSWVAGAARLPQPAAAHPRTAGPCVTPAALPVGPGPAPTGPPRAPTPTRVTSGSTPASPTPHLSSLRPRRMRQLVNWSTGAHAAPFPLRILSPREPTQAGGAGSPVAESRRAESQPVARPQSCDPQLTKMCAT